MQVFRMAENDSENFYSNSFTIENNVLKGECKPLDPLNPCEIGRTFLNVLDSKPNFVAQIDANTGKQSSFSEIKDRSVRCALWLRKQGVGAGDIITACTPNHLDSSIPVLASLYNGSIFNGWRPDITLKAAQHLVKLIQPKIIFSSEKAAATILKAAQLENVQTKVVVFGRYPGLQSYDAIIEEQSVLEVKNFSAVKIENPDKSIGVIILSSGTTGFPKGVVHSYSSVAKMLQSFKGGVIGKNVAFWYTTLEWISCYFLSLSCIANSCTRIIHDKFDPEETCKVMEKYKVQFIFFIPILLTHLFKSNVLQKYNFQSLETIFTGGTKISPRILEELRNYFSKFDTNIAFAYGTTEAGGVISVPRKNDDDLYSVGYVKANNEIKIIDIDTKETLGPNKEGEICVKTPMLMLGYYNNPQTTKETIDEEGWLRTGDKGYYNKDGKLYITDRVKEVMKFRGDHVSPTEIEDTLLTHPDVIEAAVVSVPHEVDGDRAVGFVRAAPGSKVTEEELIKLSETLGTHKKLWGGCRLLGELPKTGSGKINKAELKELARATATC